MTVTAPGERCPHGGHHVAGTSTGWRRLILVG